MIQDIESKMQPKYVCKVNIGRVCCINLVVQTYKVPITATKPIATDMMDKVNTAKY